MIAGWLAFTFALALLPTLTRAQEGGPPSQPSPERAASIFAQRCLPCHGQNGQGDGPQAQAVGLPMPDLTDPALARATTPARWFETITNGRQGTAMPPFGPASSNPLSEQERWDLVFYLYTLSTPSDQIEAGRRIYQGRCAACHGDDGTGSGPAAPGPMPDFTDLAMMAQKSQQELFETVTQGRPTKGMPSFADELDEEARWQVVDYLRTFSYDYTPPVLTVPGKDPFAGGPGLITGQVVNGTTGAATPQGITVTLIAFEAGPQVKMVGTLSTTVQSDGSFRFADLDPEAQVAYVVTTEYRGVNYGSDAIQLSVSKPEGEVTLTVYETTDQADAIRFDRVHIFADFPASDRLRIGELYIVSNAGDRTYVGSLQIPLPDEATNLRFERGTMAGRFTETDEGFIDTAPVLPGEGTTELLFSYALAYRDGLVITRRFLYPVNSLNLLVPDVGITVESEQLGEPTPVPMQGEVVYNYSTGPLTPGQEVSWKMKGKPRPSTATAAGETSRRPGPTERQALGLGLIGLALGVVAAYLIWQGWSPRQALARVRVASDRQALLEAIADLDDAYEAGELDEATYRRERSELVEELIERMQAR